MYVPNLELCRRVEELRWDDERRRVETWRLWRLAKQGERSWLSLLGCRLLCQLGRTLIRMGHQLEVYGLSQRAATDIRQ
jgi:hypothetical protein